MFDTGEDTISTTKKGWPGGVGGTYSGRLNCKWGDGRDISVESTHKKIREGWRGRRGTFWQLLLPLGRSAGGHGVTPALNRNKRDLEECL